MKECDILGGQNILRLLLHIFTGSGPPTPMMYASDRGYVTVETRHSGSRTGVELRRIEIESQL